MAVAEATVRSRTLRREGIVIDGLNEGCREKVSIESRPARASDERTIVKAKSERGGRYRVGSDFVMYVSAGSTLS